MRRDPTILARNPSGRHKRKRAFAIRRPAARRRGAWRRRWTFPLRSCSCE